MLKNLREKTRFEQVVVRIWLACLSLSFVRFGHSLFLCPFSLRSYISFVEVEQRTSRRAEHALPTEAVFYPFPLRALAISAAQNRASCRRRNDKSVFVVSLARWPGGRCGAPRRRSKPGHSSRRGGAAGRPRRLPRCCRGRRPRSGAAATGEATRPRRPSLPH